MRAIDMRSRPPYKAFCDDFVFDYESQNKTSERTGRAIPESVKHKSMELFLTEKRIAGIEKCVVPVRGSRAKEDNPVVECLLYDYPNDFIGMASITMPGKDKEKDLEIIKKYVINGLCTGINLEPGLDITPWELDNESIFHVYEFCENQNIPVMLLNGGIFHRNDVRVDYGFYAPMRIEHIAFTFPKLKIIAAHGGWPWVNLMCAVAMNYENVYLSPDCYLMDGVGGYGYIEAANRHDLQDKIMFGSVYPGYSMEWAVEYFKSCGIKESVLEKVFYDNAAKVLGVTN